MQIGRRIYFEKATGNVVYDTGEHEGSVIERTIEQDFETFLSLKNRVSNTIGIIQLGFGEYRQDFYESSYYRVNTESQSIEFSYPDPNEPKVEQPYQAPLSEKISELEARNTDLMIAIAEMAESDAIEKTEMQLAIAELAEIIAGGA